jgi:hypothetical protein
MRRNVTAKKKKQITTFLISKIASKKQEKFFACWQKKIRFEGREDFADYDLEEKLFCYQIKSRSGSD